MDPITATTTIITLATFIKDLVEVGQSIKRSIEKVRENRRRIRELATDVLRTLADLAELIRGEEDTFTAAPALLSALGNLKGEMIHVLSVCRKISPVERNVGFRAVGSQIKIWMKRDDLEEKIGRLKEHVNKCYLQFTAFSAARIEQRTARIEGSSLDTVRNTLRVEQTLIVNNVENQVKLRRLEGMMARVLLETQFGQNALNQAMEKISADPTHESLESQYLSAQTIRLIDSLQQLQSSGRLNIDTSFWDPITPLQTVFVEHTSPLHILHWILQTVLEISRDHRATQVQLMTDTLVNLGASLIVSGMASEGITWELMKINFLHQFTRDYWSAGRVVQLVETLTNVSIGYRYQLQYEPALRASQQALDLCLSLAEHSADTNLQLDTLVTHGLNLLQSGRKEDLPSVAEKAVALARPLLQQIIQSAAELSSLTPKDEYTVVTSIQALFILAEVFSSSGRTLNSYETSKEAFQMIINLPHTSHSPAGKEIDSFIDRTCKMAEDGIFSLAMLAECVILIRNLARIYPIEFSRQLLWFLYAYVYFTQNPPTAPHSMNILRIFLEPTSDSPPPEMDKASKTTTNLHEFHGDGSIIQDAVRAYYADPWELETQVSVLVRDTFITHFEEAIVVLREVVANSISEVSFDLDTVEWILYSTLELLQLAALPSHNRLIIFMVLTETVEYLNAIFVDLHSESAEYGTVATIIGNTFSRQLFIFGLLDEALAVSDSKIGYLSSSRQPLNNDLSDALIERAFLLCDMGRFAEAVQFAETNMPISSQYTPMQHPDIFLCCEIHIRIIQRTWENSRALNLLWRVFTAARDHHQAEWPDLRMHFLSVEFAAAWGHVGRTDKALRDAEKAVAFSRQEVPESSLEEQQCVLVHSLTTLSNCLAVVGRHEEAVVASQEAVSLYTKHQASEMWEQFLFTIRKQELGANAFHSLSLRLATCGDLNEALPNAKRATELFRDLVALAPRHLPALARSLQNMASILWKFDRREESVAVCAEAVSILRKVVDPETYFLPALAEALDQLVTYCKVTGDVNGASAAAIERAEVEKKSASLPCQPEFLLDETEVDSDDEDDEFGWETASEGADENLADTSLEVKTVVSEKARGVILKSVLTVQITDTSRPSLQEVQMTKSLQHEAPKSLGTLDDEDTPITELEVPTKSRLHDILSTPVEIRLNSTPMDILWWMVTGSLFAFIVWSRIAV
ncbi:hypothetical protein B0H16DRAFT_1455583 [Mycena metata]|uniref:Uncharacterized protein n=1 Tax=Mycena metata TaxID=1033252 RepID=A0AAD7JFV6_9AGAR|nr:hypothetical protein B0H16DRAFT_1455583 [Mycena metata]